MKECRVCGDNKPVTEYYKQPRNRDGLFHECKSCTEERRRVRRAADPEHTKALNRRQYENNRRYYIDKGYLRNKQKQTATLSSLTDDHRFMIEEIYEMRDLRTAVTGVAHHVDHIVPLRGENVSGLHVPWNLQVIPATDNLRKGNRH